MKIVTKVVLWTSVAFLLYPLIHIAKRSINSEDVHSIGAFLGVIGAIYGVLIAFVVFVVWEQFNSVEKATAREAGIVEDLYRLSRNFSDDHFDQKKRFAQCVKEYLLACVQEWSDLSKRQENERALSALSAVEMKLRDFQTSNDSDKIIYESLINTLKTLYECRDERVAVAKHRMPKTLINLLKLVAAVLVLRFYVLPTHSMLLGMFTVVGAVGVLVAIFEVVQDMDNPFHGVWNCSPEPFADQAKKIP